MLRSITNITAVSSTRVRVEWTAPTADHIGYVFVNGAIAAGPVVTTSTDRSAIVTLATTATAQIEIHEMAPTDTAAPSPTREIPNTRPDLKWAEVEDAEVYRVYQQQEGASEDRIFNSGLAATDGRVTLRCPVVLDGQGGQWHFFRVESLDARLHESTRAAWAYRVMEPPAPAAVGVVDGSAPGLFTMTIGA